MLMSIVAIAVALNMLLIIRKIKKCQFLNAGIDAILLVAVALLFNGSFSALATGAVGSCIVSLYLGISPIKISMRKPI